MKIITIGRTPQNTITISDASVSRHHCQIVRHDNGTFTIADFGSTNGTYVNGRRIAGEVQLSYSDQVRAGNVPVQWQQYFKTNNSHTAGIVLGIVGGVLLLAAIVVIIVLLAQKNPSNPKPGHFRINDVELAFGMNIDQLREANPSANIKKYTSENLEDIVISISSFDYYLIGGEVAVSMGSETDEVYSFTTVGKSYNTEKNISVGRTWGEMVEVYPDLTFMVDYYYYNYWAHRYEKYITAYDEATCTYFAFSYSQFTSSQIEAIHAVANPSCFDCYFQVSAISASVYQSICSSVRVSQIAVCNCHGLSYTPEGSSSGSESITVNTAEQTARRVAVAMCEGDTRTIRSLSTNDMYNEIME